MQYRQLGRTGLEVSEIGYGAWGIGGAGGGWVGAQDDESILALERFIALGGTFIDTARGYGRSEELVGRVVRAHEGEGLVVATKVPPKNGQWPARSGVPVEEAFPGDHIRASVETSLRASGLESFDVLQFHVWSDEWVGRGDWQQTIQALKDEGTIRHFGVSINDHEPENGLELVRSGAVDTVQVIYNVFHQQPEEQLLPACQEHGVGVIVRVAGEGQFRVGDNALAKLNEIDNRALAAVEGGDEDGFRALLAEMIALVRDHGETLADDDLSTSDVVVPPADTTMEEARAEFSGDGLIPG